MKNLLTLIMLVLFAIGGYAQQATLTGMINDRDGEPLIGANVTIKGTAKGTATDIDGRYTLMLDPGSYTILVTYTGFNNQEEDITVGAGENRNLDFTLQEGILFQEVVVSGSKKAEKLTESPATIETVLADEIEEYAGNAAELIARQKGIDYFRAGVAVPAFNIRGFNSNFNSKNLQVNDGRFSNLIATGLPFGPLSTVVKEDIERFEVILGPNATLYGPNAHNGLINTITKDPRRYQGTTFAGNAGATGDGDGFYSARLRHAQVLSDKFAFKLTGEYTATQEFEWADSVFIDRVGAFDENGDPIPDGQAEGYEELELDRDVDFAKTEGEFIFSPNNDIDITLKGGFSNSNYLSATNVGRNQIQDWKIFYGQLKLKSDHWFAQVYHTGSSTDSTYSIDERTKQYYRGIDAGLSDAEARGAFSYASGALFADASNRWNAELQYNNTFGNLEIIGGLQWQNDRANSQGTYLIEDDANEFYNGDAIVVNQVGGYGHFTYNFDKGWRALAAARIDYHEVYETNFVPKVGLLKIGDMGTWRLTYGQGIAAPTIFNMFSNLFGGLILGNAEGFTLSDGSTIPAQEVEKIQTFELGYRGEIIENKFFLDANTYFNISEDFLSPVTNIVPTAFAGGPIVTQRGDQDISQFQSGVVQPGDFVNTYLNFGQVNTYGLDISANYYFTPELSAYVNYSFFDWSVDEDDPENDFNADGTVNQLDILVNTPNHKMGVGVNYQGDKFFSSIFGRWVQEYNYFSSFQIASETLRDDNGDFLLYRGEPIIEDARSADTYNYGPLGGFFTIDLSVGYRINDTFILSAAASNLFNEELREFTATAPTKGLYTLQLQIDLPAITP